MRTDAVVGPDGRSRCSWGGTAPDYLAYHDEEWGRAIRDDRGIYERLTLEAFQSGLSWLTILRKRPAFRAAFDDFDAARVAAYGPSDAERLMADVGIVRNRAKVDAAISNARASEELAGGVAAFVWGFAPDEATRRAPRRNADVPAVTAESTALARGLKQAGFTFVGPTTAYALMQACGLVNDHLVDCFARDAAAAS